MKRRQFLALAAVCSALALVATTGGFSAAAADRSVDVRVVDNDRAFVGVQACEQSASPDNAADKSNGGGDGNPVEVRVTNRLSEPLDVTTVTGYADGVRVSRTGQGQAFPRLIVVSGDADQTLPFRNPVDELRVRTKTTDGSVTVAVTVDVRPKAAPGCPLAG